MTSAFQPARVARPTIRLARVDDAGILAAAEARTAQTPGLLVGWPGEIPVAAYRDKIVKLAQAGRYVVAEESGAVIGHAMLDPMPMRANAHVFTLTIVVHPGHTGVGVGETMLRDLLEWARHDRRVGKVELNVRAGNTRAQKLYRKLGFVGEARFRKRVQRLDGQFEDDLGMAWFPARADAGEPT
jgi:ribosomal protein S18 acetylase RimI-like enzyme